MNKRQNIWVWVGLSLAVMFLFSSGVGFAVDILWFEEMGYRQVFQSIFFAQLTIGLAEGLAAFVFLYANFRWALSAIGDPVTLFPPEMANTPLRQVFNRRFFHMGALIFSGLTGLLVGSTASGNWEDWLLFLNGPAFGQVDPVFQKDISFYVFQLPVFQALEGLAWAMGLLSLAGTGFLYFLKVQNEKLSAIKGPFRMNLGDGLPDKARLHLAGLGAYLLVILAWGLYLDRFEQMYDQSGLFAGPGYADIEGTLPMLALKAAATLLAAGLVAVGILRQKFKLFVGGLGLVVAAYVGGSL
ncbi:MAG: UPF0182 family protein, partial [Deltaproteobacteria bacterium]|nr:UPF0182 family protein [Deltaproteobacteria bacterium]